MISSTVHPPSRVPFRMTGVVALIACLVVLWGNASSAASQMTKLPPFEAAALLQDPLAQDPDVEAIEEDVEDIEPGADPNAPLIDVDEQPAAVDEVAVFDRSRIWLAIFLVVVCGAILLYIALARRGTKLFIRKISGLEAVDEAVGRATEMGKSCLYVPGIMDLNDIQTVAGLTILSRVAELTAEYQTPINVPTARSLVMTTAREAVQASYYAAGRSDAFRPDDIYYLTDEQFGYVASVTGSMVREKPAACFYMGAFFAESLLLAETGNAIGAIQVAGTAMPSQLPFFVAACDYTLIGEEFFAASAYLSGEPMQLGSLKGQDFGKAIAVLLIVAGCFAATAGEITEQAVWNDILDYLANHICGSEGFWP